MPNFTRGVSPSFKLKSKDKTEPLKKDSWLYSAHDDFQDPSKFKVRSHKIHEDGKIKQPLVGDCTYYFYWFDKQLTGQQEKKLKKEYGYEVKTGNDAKQTIEFNILNPKSNDTDDNKTDDNRSKYWKRYIYNNFVVDGDVDNIVFKPSYGYYQLFFLAGAFLTPDKWIDDNYHIKRKSGTGDPKVYVDSSSALVAFDKDGNYLDDFQIWSPLYDNSNAPNGTAIEHVDVPLHNYSKSPFSGNKTTKYKIVTIKIEDSPTLFLFNMSPGTNQTFHQHCNATIGCNTPAKGIENENFSKWIKKAPPLQTSEGPKPINNKPLGNIYLHLTKVKDKAKKYADLEIKDKRKPREKANADADGVPEWSE